MKKIFFSCFTGLFLISNINSIAYSQNSNDMARLKPQPVPEKNISIPPGNEMDPGPSLLNELTTNELKKKAVKKFARQYKNQPDASWFKSSNGLLVAFFKIDDIQTFIYYNEKGTCEFIMRYYKEEKLPEVIRNLVESTYDNFSIYQVTEVRKNNQIAYVVKMENKKFWKTVKVIDGEMEVTEEYSKR